MNVIDHKQNIGDKYNHPYLGICKYVRQKIVMDSKSGNTQRIYIKHDKIELGGDLFICDVSTFGKGFIPHRIGR